MITTKNPHLGWIILLSMKKTHVPSQDITGTVLSSGINIISVVAGLQCHLCENLSIILLLPYNTIIMSFTDRGPK